MNRRSTFLKLTEPSMNVNSVSHLFTRPPIEASILSHPSLQVNFGLQKKTISHTAGFIAAMKFSNLRHILWPLQRISQRRRSLIYQLDLSNMLI